MSIVDFLDDIPFEADPMSEDEGEELRRAIEEQNFIDPFEEEYWNQYGFQIHVDKEDNENELWEI
jgi:hypothetical protein